MCDIYAGSFKVPVSALNIFDTIAILALVPVFDGVVYPYFKKIGYPLTMLRKIGLGFVVAMGAMVIAAVVEVARVKAAPASCTYLDCDDTARNNISPCQNIDNYNPLLYQDYLQGSASFQPLYCSQFCENTTLSCISCDQIPQQSTLSVFWQIPQFVLIGTSEILASITSLEFFYSQAPTTMRSVTQSLNLATSALGSFVVIPLVVLVNSNKNNQWIPGNLDQGHLDWYYFLLAGLMGVTLLYYQWICIGYQYKSTSDLTFPDEDEANEPLNLGIASSDVSKVKEAKDRKDETKCNNDSGNDSHSQSSLHSSIQSTA